MSWGPNDEEATRNFGEMAAAPRAADTDPIDFAITLKDGDLIGGRTAAH